MLRLISLFNYYQSGVVSSRHVTSRQVFSRCHLLLVFVKLAEENTSSTVVWIVSALIFSNAISASSHNPTHVGGVCDERLVIHPLISAREEESGNTGLSSPIAGTNLNCKSKALFLKIESIMSSIFF
mmetsp:Transcript_17581/g.19733  ORF Transcript_17581/g.19733 Transcript_17581/m.19733 type:complete len:127 (+) Transcript_17581:42-422(+)